MSRQLKAGVVKMSVNELAKARAKLHAPVREAGVHETTLDGLDATVHHVARGNATRAGLGVVDCNLGDARRALLLVKRVGSVGLENAAVAVRGVFAQADVACEQERRVELRQEPECKDDGRLRRGSVRALRVLQDGT